MARKTQAYRLKSGRHRGLDGKTYRPGEIVVSPLPLDEKWPTRFECLLVRRRKGRPEVNKIIYDDELSPEDVKGLGDIPVEEDASEPETETETASEETTEPTPDAPVKLVKKHIKSPREKRGWWVINEATGKEINDSPLTRAEAIELERGT